MDDPRVDDPVRDPIRDALQTLDGVDLVTNYLAAFEYLDRDGERHWRVIPGSGQDTGTCYRLADIAHRVADRWMDDIVDECIDGS